MRSIRARTLLLVLSLLGLTTSLISYKSYRDAQHEIEELFDAQLAQTARLLEGMVSRDMPLAARRAIQDALDQAVLAQRQAGDEALAGGHRYESKLAFQVLDERGRVLLQSASAPAGVLEQMVADLQRQDGNAQVLAPGEPLAKIAERLAGYQRIRLGQHHWRLFILRDPRDSHWILVGERQDVRGELVEKVALRSLLPDLVGLPLLALLVWLAVGWGLRPLQRMAESIKARAPDNLAPLVLSPLPVELEPMGAAINRLLLQVNQLLEQEKRFIADAAHELRTPLAVLRIHAQNAQDARDPADRDEALRQLGGGVERATRVVTQLLTLARLDPNVAQLAMAELDLLGYLRNELAELTPLALARQQELTLEAAEPGDYRLLADGPSLGTLLQNLVGNALQYSPSGGRIQVLLEARADELLLRIQDSGPGVPAEQRQRLFERFYRLGEGQGAGLGLSIVQRVVELHRGRIELGDSPLGGLEVCVHLPRRR
ncbi:two-component system, OmpR family, sensor histidine kinase QseC [Pseudomonas benzenivorans]|nr:ATP-binding protein [Pseudomonas benzenivorans]SDH79940.1 two-component system, OmpR family, sensor histidine kinase QseC [Pseudomonas benzenivorans]